MDRSALLVAPIRSLHSCPKGVALGLARSAIIRFKVQHYKYLCSVPQLLMSYLGIGGLTLASSACWTFKTDAGWPKDLIGRLASVRRACKRKRRDSGFPRTLMNVGYSEWCEEIRLYHVF